MQNGTSFVGLLRDLSHQLKTFMREEFQLAKTEVVEKISKLGKNAVSVAVGGLLAYGGLLLSLGGLGLLLAFLLERLGMPLVLAGFAGFGTIGLLVLAVGGLMVVKGLKGLSKVSLVPEKTIETLHQLKGDVPAPQSEPARQKEGRRSSEDIKTSVLVTENQMAGTLEELGDRLTLRRARRKAAAEIRAHPYRWSLLAMGTGAAGSYLLGRSWARHHNGLSSH